MMKGTILIILASFLVIITPSCRKVVVFDDAREREEVFADYASRQQQFPGVSVTVDQQYNRTLQEALVFLYAYMPLSDVAEYPPAFFRMNAEYALRVQKDMSWGSNISALIFRHFVLPVRVSNERLDESRMIFHETLYERVCGLSMKEAVLAVNRWCSEMMDDTEAGVRTLSPLTVLRSAEGSVLERTVVLVTALRSVGIPARLVYSPVQSDDNGSYTWVEAWADGEWYFVDVDKPSSGLSKRWLQVPDAVVIYSDVFGHYKGVETIVEQLPGRTKISLVEEYLAPSSLVVQVTDVSGMPVRDASVELQMYKNAGFKTVSTAQTDSIGEASFLTGRGDVLIWATDGEIYGYANIISGDVPLVQLVLNRRAGARYSEELVLKTSSLLRNYQPGITGQLESSSDGNNLVEASATASKDEVTRPHTSSAGVPDRSHVQNKLDELGYGTEMVSILLASKSNYAVLLNFLEGVALDFRPLAIQLLELLPPVYLKDVSLDVLRDHFSYSLPFYQSDPKLQPWFNHILDPRVANEPLVPYRSFLIEALGESMIAAFQTAPMSMVEWVAREVEVTTPCTTGSILFSPVGTWKSKKTDRLSRDILFIALARSLGIPAWRDVAHEKVYYVEFVGERSRPEVREANLDLKHSTIIPEGRLVITYNRLPGIEDPLYGTHFTVSRYKDGRYVHMPFDPLTTSRSTHFGWSGAALDPGDYLLTTGYRRATGELAVKLSFFQIHSYRNTYVVF